MKARAPLAEKWRGRERGDDRLQPDDERDHACRHAVIDRGKAAREIAALDQHAGDRMCAPSRSVAGPAPAGVIASGSISTSTNAKRRRRET